MDAPTIQPPPSIGPEPAMWSELLALPWRRYEILSHLQPLEAQAAIARITGPRRSLWRTLSARRHDFEGGTDAGGFHINRVIRYRNSFLPMIRGQLTPASGGTLITVSMRPLWFVIVFWILWMAFAIALLAFSLAKGDEQSRPAMTLLGAGMLTVGYLMCSVGFGIEARWAKQMLERALSDRS